MSFAKILLPDPQKYGIMKKIGIGVFHEKPKGDLLFYLNCHVSVAAADFFGMRRIGASL